MHLLLGCALRAFAAPTDAAEPPSPADPAEPPSPADPAPTDLAEPPSPADDAPTDPANARRRWFEVLRPTILGEVDYRAIPAPTEGTPGLEVARLRPGLLFTPAPAFRAVVSVEFAADHPTLLDAYGRVRVAPGVELTIGLSKPPLFASFTHEPVHLMPLPTRSPVVTGFFVRRDVGVDVHLAPATAPVEAWLRVGNGTGSPLGNDSPAPAGYGLVDLVFGRAHVAHPTARHGLRVGVGALVESTRDRPGVAGATPFGFVFYRPAVVSGLRTVAEAHAVAYTGPLRWTVEGAFAREGRSRDDDGNPDTPREALTEVTSGGLTAEVQATLLGQPRGVGVAPHAAPGRWSGGALELAARYDGLWLGRGADDIAPGGAHGANAALKWWPADFGAVTVSGFAWCYDQPPLEDPDRRWSWAVEARASVFWGLGRQDDAR